MVELWAVRSILVLLTFNKKVTMMMMMNPYRLLEDQGG